MRCCKLILINDPVATPPRDHHKGRRRGPDRAFEAKHSSLTRMRSLWSDRGGALSASRLDLHGAGQRAEPLWESYDVGSTTISAVMVGSWVMQMSL